MVPSTVMTSVAPRMTPERKFMQKMSSMITSSTDSTRLMMNVSMASCTRSDWKNTFSQSMLAGRRVAFSSFIFFSTRAPTLTMSVPEAAAMLMPSAD